MNALIEEAHRIRSAEPYTSARSALELVRWRASAPQMDDGDEWTEDGFTLSVTVRPDDEPFDAGDVAPTFTHEPSRETIPNPSWKGDDRRPGAGFAYAETPSNPRSHRIAWYRSQGASRAVAVEMAEHNMREELDRWTWDYGPTPYVVTVTASRASVTLGRSALYGVDFGDSYGDNARYLAEIARDIADEAKAEAIAARAAICADEVQS